ncbi:P-loop NTPase fold protein, partial [Morganella morganii]
MSVKSTIDFYLAEESPGYALQITGEWGAGKTHAVKKILQNDMYYLSLFDIQSSDEVYSSIFYLMQKNKEKAKRALSNLKK